LYVILPNFVKIGHTAAQISRLFFTLFQQNVKIPRLIALNMA